MSVVHPACNVTTRLQTAAVEGCQDRFPLNMHLITNVSGIQGNHTAVGLIESYRNCICNGTKAPPTEHQDKVEIDSFVYIVVVVVLYATSITFLLIRYGRNYDEEKDFKYHYSEFVKRDRFQALTYRNKLALERTKQHLESFQTGDSESKNSSYTDLKSEKHRSKGRKKSWGSSKPVVAINCPLITITNCSDGSQNSLGDSTLRIHGLGPDPGTMANSGSSACNDVRKDLLMVPLSAGRGPGDMALSYDSGVDYLGHHVTDDVPDCEWEDETVTDYGHSGKYVFPKCNSSMELQSFTAVVCESRDQRV